MQFKNLITLLKRYFITPIISWRYQINEYNHLKKIINSFERTNKLKDKVIVINAARFFRETIDIEVFLGLIFALNGAKVKVLMDDGMMMHWDTSQDYYIPKLKKLHKYTFNPYRMINIYERIFSFRFLYVILKRHIRKKGYKTYKNGNIDFIKYSEIFKNRYINLKNLDELHKHAASSTVRFFLTSELDYNIDYIKNFYNLSLKNAVLSRAVGEYISDIIKPDFCINAHGIYSTHGPAYEYLKKKGIKSLVVASVNIHTNEITNIFFPDTPAQTLTRSVFWKNYKNVPVTEEMRQKVKEFFNYRTQGEALDIKSYNLMNMDNKLNLKKEKKYKYYIALFPHLIWDGNILDRHIVFDGFIDWLVSTIKFLKNKKDIKLFIKPHPYEKNLRDPKAKIHSILKNYFNFKEIENVEFILPEKSINTYEFIKSAIDLGIVYDGFLGVELPYFGIPTITCALGGFTSIEGGNITIKSREEYFHYLSNLDKTIQDFKRDYEKKVENIIRYVYWYTTEINIKLPTLKFYYSKGLHLLHLTKKDLILTDKTLEVFNKFTSN